MGGGERNRIDDGKLLMSVFIVTPAPKHAAVGNGPEMAPRPDSDKPEPCRQETLEINNSRTAIGVGGSESSASIASLSARPIRNMLKLRRRPSMSNRCRTAAETSRGIIILKLGAELSRGSAA